MGKVILFSPVGGTDPISNDNARDGALIHCCRVYKPDLVYLYMSQWVIANEDNDKRYSYCLDKLYEHLGKPLDCVRLDRPELVEVQDFNYFYDDFGTEIRKIMQTMESEDQLIINTSSGSPAMKSALVVLATLGEIDAALIQVTTPNKSINTHDHKNYDVETLWELNEDNNASFENRCSVIACPSLMRIKNEGLIKKLINSYDYIAALNVVNMIPKRQTTGYKHLIEYAYHRLRLAKNDMIRLEKEYGDIDYLPVRSQEFRDITEYTLSLFVKKKREEYADFIRGVTPLFVKLFIYVLEKEASVSVLKYCHVDYSKGTVIWSEEKLNSNEVTKTWISIWQKNYGSEFKFGFVNSDTLLVLIEHYCGYGSDVFQSANRLREVEKTIRNIAAHEISIITDERIKQVTKYTSDEIIADIKDLFGYAGISMSKVSWDSYELMNADIISKIESGG